MSIYPDGTGRPGDFNGNGVVGFGDFLEFVKGFGERQGEAGWNPQIDPDGNGEVGFSDFLAFARLYGKKPVAAKPGMEYR